MLILPNTGWLSVLVLALSAVASVAVLTFAGYLTERLHQVLRRRVR